MIENKKSDISVIRDAILDRETFRRMTMTGKVKAVSSPWIKIVVRPLTINERLYLQFIFFNGTSKITKNYEGEKAIKPLEEVLAIQYLQILVQTTNGTLRLRITKTGKIEFTREPPPILTHSPSTPDRDRKTPLSKALSADYLKAIDILDSAGSIKPTMQAKYRQINAFIKRLEMLIHDEVYADGNVEVIDCGCGNIDLTFSAYHYLYHIRHLKPHITAIDRNPEFIEKYRLLREKLKWPGLDFYVSPISDFTPERTPDLVLSLHTTNAATDESIAKGIQWISKSIVVTPCSPEETGPQIKAAQVQPLLRDGLLKQKTSEIVRDAIRAQILRIMGYKTGVIEFDYPITASNNLMIRAEKIRNPGDPQMIREYLDMVQFWHVEPRIANLLGEPFRQLLQGEHHQPGVGYTGA